MTDIVHRSNVDEVSMCETLLEITQNLNLNGISKYKHKTSTEALYRA